MEVRPPPALEEESGWFCTPAEASEQFFRAMFDPSTGQLVPARQGEFFDAVSLAHTQGQRGAGRTVAVLDSGFDMSIPALADVALDSSVTTDANVRERGHHGTVVALLVRHAAPDARLLLLDVAPSGNPKKRGVAESMRRAFAAGVDVVNVSLEFTSRQPDELASGVPPAAEGASPEDMIAELTTYLLRMSAEGLARPCLPPCAVCEALPDEPDGTIVVAAAGNRDEIGAVCPSCNPRAIGCGFEHEEHLTVDGGHVVRRSVPKSFKQNPFVELVVGQPDGFDGSSFAAPLVAGMMAALHDDRSTLADMLWFPSALSPTALVQQELRKRTDPAAEAPQLVDAALRGYRMVAEACPNGHRHWLPDQARPCAVCSWCMSSWYRDQSALLLAIGRADVAREVAGLGTVVLPRSAEIAGNFGEASYRLAAAAAPSSAERRVCLAAAAASFERAIALGAPRATYEPRLALVHATTW